MWILADKKVSGPFSRGPFLYLRHFVMVFTSHLCLKFLQFISALLVVKSGKGEWILSLFGFFVVEGWNNDTPKNTLKRNGTFNEPNSTMEIAQLLLSLLHAWGMDPDLDRVCEGKLGLLRPMIPVSFGVLSKQGE